MSTSAQSAPGHDLLIVDDDAAFCQVLARALARKGYNVATAHDTESALQAVARRIPDYAIVDLRIGEESGLELVGALHRTDKQMRILVLTGYASIATAVEAIKLGAIHYLTKPSSVEEIVATFEHVDGEINTPLAYGPLSVKRLEWEHLQKILMENNGNVSATARQLGMHRRTLQRKLNKRPAKK